KFFATADLVEQIKDRGWLVKVTSAINQHWHRQNARKKNRPAIGSQNNYFSPANLPVSASV
ncbi:MAG TPA: hypothetical protein VK769_02790, partial [Verrucomicrobiae bacterium]|nr:hypothetical protein [Verrucomicrobiae bacterium]